MTDSVAGQEPGVAAQPAAGPDCLPASPRVVGTGLEHVPSVPPMVLAPSMPLPADGWIRMESGSRPAYVGIQGGTAPLTLMRSADGQVFAFTGQTGNDFTQVLRGVNASSPPAETPPGGEGGHASAPPAEAGAGLKHPETEVAVSPEIPSTSAGAGVSGSSENTASFVSVVPSVSAKNASASQNEGAAASAPAALPAVRPPTERPVRDSGGKVQAEEGAGSQAADASGRPGAVNPVPAPQPCAATPEVSATASAGGNPVAQPGKPSGANLVISSRPMASALDAPEKFQPFGLEPRNALPQAVAGVKEPDDPMPVAAGPRLLEERSPAQPAFKPLKLRSYMEVLRRKGSV